MSARRLAGSRSCGGGNPSLMASCQCTRVSKDGINAIRKLVPLLTFGFERSPAGGRQLVKFAAAGLFQFFPIGSEQLLPFHAVQGRVETALLQLEVALGL